MMKRRLSIVSYSRGFTLVELVVVLVICTLIMGGIAELIVTILQQPNYRLGTLNSIDQVRTAGTTFVNEIRNAQTGNDGSFALNQASSTQIIFFTSYNSATPGVIDRVRYFVASSTFYKGTIVPTGLPYVYNTANEKVVPIITNLVGTTSVFSYYNGTYAGTSSPLTQPVNVTQVTFVGIALNVLEQNNALATTSYSFTAGAAIRSLKTNLGN
ncbi:MAG TPA: prepilin-type N-terminal cleavage/methylation domain-containing protein [Candidatus Paceibacterota bacterium]|nr:prepilin-type N-terminal cleavage/methylation domain-containing protein [Candidatus Paceibacterota bacterium]